jgi:hypothetical protein
MERGPGKVDQEHIAVRRKRKVEMRPIRRHAHPVSGLQFSVAEVLDL